MRARSIAAFLIVGVALLGASADRPLHEVTSGIELVAANYQKQPPSELLAGEFSMAWQFAERNAAALGYPWLDATTQQLVIRAVDASGEALATSWARARPVPTRVERAAWSFAELEAIKHGAIGPESGLPDFDAIYASAPDFDHNRVVLTVDRLSPRLLRALADRYGLEPVAVHVDARRPNVGY